MWFPSCSRLRNYTKVLIPSLASQICQGFHLTLVTASQAVLSSHGDTDFVQIHRFSLVFRLRTPATVLSDGSTTQYILDSHMVSGFASLPRFLYVI